MEIYKPFGRPLDVDPAQLAKTRESQEENDLKGLPSTIVYLAESEFMSKWTCIECGTDRIPCAQAECPNCNNPRPAAWRDPEQGESKKLGKHRAAAGWRE